MTIIQVLIILVIVGLILWAVNTFIPMDAKVKTLLNAVVIVGLVLWLIISVLLPMAGMGGGKVPG